MVGALFFVFVYSCRKDTLEDKDIDVVSNIGIRGDDDQSKPAVLNDTIARMFVLNTYEEWLNEDQSRKQLGVPFFSRTINVLDSLLLPSSSYNLLPLMYENDPKHIQTLMTVSYEETGVFVYWMEREVLKQDSNAIINIVKGEQPGDSIIVYSRDILNMISDWETDMASNIGPGQNNGISLRDECDAFRVYVQKLFGICPSPNTPWYEDWCDKLLFGWVWGPGSHTGRTTYVQGGKFKEGKVNTKGSGGSRTDDEINTDRAEEWMTACLKMCDTLGDYDKKTKAEILKTVGNNKEKCVKFCNYYENCVKDKTRFWDNIRNGGARKIARALWKDPYYIDIVLGNTLNCIDPESVDCAVAQLKAEEEEYGVDVAKEHFQKVGPGWCCEKINLDLGYDDVCLLVDMWGLDLTEEEMDCLRRQSGDYGNGLKEIKEMLKGDALSITCQGRSVSTKDMIERAIKNMALEGHCIRFGQLSKSLDDEIAKELSLRFGLKNSERSLLHKNRGLLHLLYQVARDCGDDRVLLALENCKPITDDDAIHCITLNLLGLNIDKDDAKCVVSAGLTPDIANLLSGGASAEDVENAIKAMKNSGNCDMTVFWNTFMGTNFTKEEIDCMLEADAHTDAIPTLMHRMHVLKGDDQKKRFINMICHPELMDPRDDWQLIEGEGEQQGEVPENEIEILKIEGDDGTSTTGCGKKQAESGERGNVEDLDFKNCNDEGILLKYNSTISKLGNNTLEPYSAKELEGIMRNMFSLLTRGAAVDVADNFLNIFFHNKDNHRIVEDYDLNRLVADNYKMKIFVKEFGKRFGQEVKKNHGDVCSIEKFNIKDLRPIFNGAYNLRHGLQILINDTEKVSIFLNDDTCDYDEGSKEWKATFCFIIEDHFGMDKQDALKHQHVIRDGTIKGYWGFAAWWRLQHCKGYAPFITRIKVNATLKGKI